MAPEELLVSWVSEWWIYVLNILAFASISSYIYMCGSGPTELLNSNPIRARIHIHNAADDLEILPMKKLSRQKTFFSHGRLQLPQPPLTSASTWTGTLRAWWWTSYARPVGMLSSSSWTRPACQTQWGPRPGGRSPTLYMVTFYIHI